MSDFKPIKLKRAGTVLNKAILREDGIHFINYEGKEQKVSEYSSIEDLNDTLRLLGHEIFQVDEE